MKGYRYVFDFVLFFVKAMYNIVKKNSTSHYGKKISWQELKKNDVPEINEM